MIDLTFSLEAMKTIKDVMGSCKRFMLTPVTENQKYFLETMAKGSSVSAGEFLRNLPERERDKLFADFFNFAGRLVSEVIPKWLVLEYFGSSNHIGKSLEDILLLGLSKEKQSKILLAHTLIPGNVQKLEEQKISVKYSNGGKDVLISGINIGENRVVEGDWVLVHFASIIEHRPQKDLVDTLLAHQAEDELFKGALSSVSSIDYDDLKINFCETAN